MERKQSKNGLRRDLLWIDDDKCKNCGVTTVLPSSLEMKRCVKGRYLVSIPDNMATLQHVYDRLHPMRHPSKYHKTPSESRYTLFCNKCNTTDNDMVTLARKLGAKLTKPKIKQKTTTMSTINGALLSSLTRNTGQVKRDRAEIINRAAERSYKRTIEDLYAQLEELIAGRDAQLDMSPSDINKIVTAAEFQSTEFCQKDMNMTMQIREVRVKLEEFHARYKHLFGTEVVLGPAYVPTSSPAAVQA